MDEYLLSQAERYNKLLTTAKPPAKTTGRPNVDTDTSINVRIRPVLDDDEAPHISPAVVRRAGADGVVDLHELRRPVRGLSTLNSSCYQVDGVFGPEDTTETLYTTSVQALVPWSWSGGVSTVFAYGQTGSGKTYTVSALEKMMARDLMSGRLPGLRSVFLSVVELVGNSAFDLLADRRPVALLEDTLGAIRVAGGEERHVKDEASLLALIEAAASLRRTASTQKNDTSSRSHAICRIRLQDEASSNADDGFLYLVDLAGSEAARDKTRHSADRLKETKDINLSLSVLKDCIRGRASLALHGGSGNPPAAAGRAAKTYIPFRQSALTKMLKHVFDPSTERQCRTVVVACVNPCLLDAGASKNTLRYAEMLRVEVPKPAAAAAYDAASPSTWSNSQLRRWIADNSGSPAISDFYLAPFETGKQLIQLPEAEFTSRCLQTPGVTSDQAAAFWTKFWSLHVDSKQAGGGGGGGGLQAHLLSSKDTRPEMAGVPFKQRIRPGMVVSWTATQGAPEHIALEKRNLALVLCAEGEGEGEGEAYRCCLVAKGLMKGSFGVFLWTQFAVRAADMEAEVLLQYDMATRLYYETL